MKAPLSWIKDFVEFDIPMEELAERLTMTGLEVDDIQMVGLRSCHRPVGVHATEQKEVACQWAGLGAG